MARKLRVEYEGAIYHVTVRSNGGRGLFKNDGDRRYLLDRFGEAAATYQVRVYLFCLMSNHFHLVVETPKANLGRFMQGVLTGYGVYYNLKHRLHGHVTQGRYGARLVEGNEYLLKLSRYVHLNPVKIADVKSKSLSERLEVLRTYSWSSFRAYVGMSPRNDFIAYEPLLALIGGGKADRERRYREYVEAGVATDDDEFAAALWRSVHCIGGDEFREGVEDRYRTLMASRRVSEDVSFRRTSVALPVETVLKAVASAAGLEPRELRERRRDSRWRCVAARMLCRYGGMTQRSAAGVLGVRTGVAVNCQLKKLAKLLDTDEGLRAKLLRIERRLDREQQRQAR